MVTFETFDIVIYHGNCFDGFTAAWVARKHSPNAEFVPGQYGDDPPDVAGKRVLICDFSYPRDVLLELACQAAYVLVLDHHKTAEADLGDLLAPGLDIIFDLHRSGAGLTWDVLHDDPRPAIVDFVEDRDLWRFAFGELTRAFHAALSTVAFDFAAWDEIAEQATTRADLVIESGRSVLRFTQLIAEKLAARARIGWLGRHQVWIVNVPLEFVSDTAEVLGHREPHLPVLGWSWDGENGDFCYSLRSRDDGPDVSSIAREFGGGGHEHAAGFRNSTMTGLDHMNVCGTVVADSESDELASVLVVPRRSETRADVELLLKRWGNAVSFNDPIAGKMIVGDRACSGREPTVDAIVDLVHGQRPRQPDARPWWDDVNERAQRAEDGSDAEKRGSATSCDTPLSATVSGTK